MTVKTLLNMRDKTEPDINLALKLNEKFTLKQIGKSRQSQ